MNGQHHGGKGSAQRPVNQAKFESNWDAIFAPKTPNYLWHCEQCDTDLAEGDFWQQEMRESYDVGDRVIWETVLIDRCENCGSDWLIEYRGTEQ